MKNQYILGTRGSALALAQSDLVISKLNTLYPDTKFEIKKILTSGDKKQGTKLAENGDKKDWIIEIEDEILGSKIDFAIHSAKDVPVEIANGTSLIPLDITATVSDVLITKSNIGSQIKSLNELPKGYSIGTSSLRRKAQLLNLRNDLQIVNLRGNVTTRLEKLRFHDELDGIVLAMAGIERLQLLEKYQSNIFIIPETEIFPAIGQGRLAAQVLNENNETVNLLKSIQDLNAVTVLSAERKLVEKLGADCNSAVGIKCKLDNDKFAMSARVLSSDGNICIEENLFGEKVNADKIADQLAETLLSRGAAQYL